MESGNGLHFLRYGSNIAFRRIKNSIYYKPIFLKKGSWNTTANMVAKERYGHSLYEVYRAIESNPKYKQLADIMGEAQKKLYRMSNEYSVKGNYPNDVQGGNIYAEEYKHEPYAKAIRDYVNMAMPMFREAVANGAFNAATVKHFQHLLEYIR